MIHKTTIVSNLYKKRGILYTNNIDYKFPEWQGLTIALNSSGTQTSNMHIPRGGCGVSLRKHLLRILQDYSHRHQFKTVLYSNVIEMLR